MSPRVIIGGFLEAATSEQHFRELVTKQFGDNVDMFVMFRGGQRGALVWVPSVMELVSVEAVLTAHGA